MNNCTAIVINFLREPYLFKCLESLKANYPQISILVGENGQYTDEKNQLISPYGKYFEVSFDAGVCKGRNFLLNKVETDYVLVGDDDFYYDQNSNLQAVIDFLDRHPEIDLVGGRVVENGVVRNYQGFMELQDGVLTYAPLELDNYQKDVINYKKCDITFNYFIARTEVIKKAMWDEKIKVAYEHSDFFLKLKDLGVNVYFTPDMLVIHKPQIDVVIGPEYGDYRRRRSDKQYFFEKHNLKYAIDMRGVKDTLAVDRQDTITAKEVRSLDFLITTMDRPRSLEKLLMSIAKYYPEANIYIGDNGHYNKQFYIDLWPTLYKAGLKRRPKAYNVGLDKSLPYTRNFLMNNTPNEYKLLLDDDFVFTKDTKINRLLSIAKSDPKIGIVGGAVSQRGIRHYEGHLEIKDGTLFYLEDKETWHYHDGIKYRFTEMCFNFIIVKTECWKNNRWDEQFKISGEHTVFFLSLKGKNWKVAYCPEVVVEHEQDYPNGYKQMRKRTEFWLKIFEKFNINRIVGFNGQTYEYNNGELKEFVLTTEQKHNLYTYGNYK